MTTKITSVILTENSQLREKKVNLPISGMDKGLPDGEVNEYIDTMIVHSRLIPFSPHSSCHQNPPRACAEHA